MVRAKCPFCGEVNEVGLFEEEQGAGPAPMMKTCSHFVFFSPTRFPGIYYAQREFHVDVPGGLAAEAELLRILSGSLGFVGPIAFAPTKEARERAHTAVEDFLRARKILALRGRE